MKVKITFGGKQVWYRKAEVSELTAKAKDGDVVVHGPSNILKTLETAIFSSATSFSAAGLVFVSAYWFTGTRRSSVLKACESSTALELSYWIKEDSPNRLAMNKMFSQPAPLP